MASQVIAVPKWFIILRGIQLLFAVIILGMSAYGVYWIHFNSWGFAVFTSLATMLIVIFGVLTTHVAALKGVYNYWALLGLDAIAVIFWLASMASLAATRATFTVPTIINSCSNDGSGGVCNKKRDTNLEKRGYVATNSYLSMMSGAAGLSGLEMLLFIATLAIFALSLKKQRSSTTSPGPTTNDKLEAHPLQSMGPQVPVQQYQQQQYQQEQYAPPSQQQYEQVPVHYQQQQQYMPQVQQQNQQQQQYMPQVQQQNQHQQPLSEKP